VAEWLRRWTANPMGSARVSSNLIPVENFFSYLIRFWSMKLGNICLSGLNSHSLIKKPIYFMCLIFTIAWQYNRKKTSCKFAAAFVLSQFESATIAKRSLKSTIIYDISDISCNFYFLAYLGYFFSFGWAQSLLIDSFPEICQRNLRQVNKTDSRDKSQILCCVLL
jgi:hypothetical protein